MQVSVTCRHGSIPDDVRDQIARKSRKLLTFFERVSAITVTVDIGKDRVKVELLVDTEHRHDFVAQGEGELVSPTFDRVYQKMEQQIKKYKQKAQDHRRDKPLNEIASERLADEEQREDDVE